MKEKILIFKLIYSFSSSIPYRTEISFKWFLLKREEERERELSIWMNANMEVQKYFKRFLIDFTWLIFLKYDISEKYLATL